MASIDRPPAKGNLGLFALRPEQPPPRPAKPGHPIIPPSRRSFAEIRSDPRLSDKAKNLASYLDGRCLAFGKWAAWPKVSTIAEACGWKGEPRAFRKKAERAFRELIDSGDVARPRLGELVAWHDAEGVRAGLDWPSGLRRNLCRSAAICVLGWKLAEAQDRLPSLTACDIGVASSAPVAPILTPPDVACDPPDLSHGGPPEMSHPKNVRTPNVRSEPNTLDGFALASGGEGEPSMPTDSVATVEVPPAPPQPDRSRRIAAYRLATSLLGRDQSGRFRDLRPRVDEAGAIAWTVPLGGGPSPDAAELAELERLKPEFLEELRGRGFKVPRPTSATTPRTEGSPTRAPKVAPGVRKNVRGLVSRLRIDGATNRDADEAARSLVDALGPHEDHAETVRVFEFWCREIRRGSMPEGAVLDSFEAACGPKVKNRGALFVRLVKKARSSP